MAKHQITNLPHKRFNLLTGEWLLVSPHRTDRPWTGQQEEPGTAVGAQYDPECYLCPGNRRAGGIVNPEYTSTFVFTNDYAALLPEAGAVPAGDDPLLKMAPESGICRVLCYNPRHDLTMARMSVGQIQGIVAAWISEFQTLQANDAIAYVQIFENRGEIMGCSNPHPHGQIWANSSIPTIPAREDVQQAHYHKEHGSCLLCDYLQRELALGERILFTNDSFVCLVPFWATWPFETMILPRRHLQTIDQLKREEQKDLAVIMQQLGICYDNLFATSFPYSMGMHQRPVDCPDGGENDGGRYDYWHFHIHYYPPLLRSKSVKKHMVGYEMFGMPQRDITAEKAADMLRAQKRVHYLNGESA